ncbi:phage tail tape measure protein [Listeria ilorinensis]|uniref:phage tail tape measure protein n=1 Tax=Listeria ilorinensis TaxID=2867439 RepID=UPI001EF3F4B1|nr:phage tail tape measure protein [Listeria ilorinensis]
MAGNASPLGQMIVEMDLNSSKFTNSMTAVKRSLKSSESQMKAQMAVFDRADDKLGKLEAQYDGLSRSLKINEKHVEGLTKAYKEEVAANGEASVRAQNLARSINDGVAKQARLEAQLKATSRAMDLEKLNLQELNNQMQANGRFSAALAQKQQLAGNKMGAMRTQYAAMGQKINDLTRIRDAEIQKLNVVAQTYGKTSSQYTNQAARVQELDNELVTSGRTMDSYAKKIGGMSPELDGFRNSMDSVSNTLKTTGQQAWNTGKTVTTHFSAPIALGLGAATKVAADFESEMSDVQAVSNASAAEMEKFKALAIDLGAKTKFSAKEAASGIEELIKAGVSTTDILNGGLAGALDLAVAGELDLASAAEIASTALNAFKDDNISVSKAADILAGAANASATDVSSMKESLQQVSAVASGVGMSFEDTSTALAVFAQNGLKGSDAGTSLKTMLSRLHPQTDKAWSEFMRLGLITTNTTAAMKTLSENGIQPLSNDEDVLIDQMHDLAEAIAGPGASASKVEKEFNKLLEQSGAMQSAFYDSNGELKSFAEIAELLQESLKGMNREQRSAALQTMFGSDAVRAANIAYKEGAEGIQKMNDEMNKTTAAEVAAKKMDNLKGQIEELKGAAETFAISAGSTLIPAFTDIVKSAQKILDGFNDLNPETQKFIMKLGLTAAAAGPAIMAFGGVSRGLGEIFGLASKTTTGVSRLLGVMKQGKVSAIPLSAGLDLVDAAMIGVGKNSVKATGALTGVAASTKTTGTGMKAAAGSTKLLGTVLGGLTSPAGLAVLGIGAVGLAVYGLKKAYDDNKTTVDVWGADVNKHTADVLTKVQGLNSSATGEFNLMAQGISGSSDAMIEDFSRMGTSIENDLKARIEGLNEALKLVPENAKAAVEDVVKDEEQRTQQALDSVKENNARISEIKQQAKDNDRNMTIEESKRIMAIEQANAEEYINLTVDNKNDRKAILDAMTGDVSKATEDQATAWAKGLAQQRQTITSEAAETKEAFKQKLLDSGIEEGSDVMIKSLAALDEASKQSTDAIDQQLLKIAERYPEIADQISLSNGQTIDSTQGYSNAMINENQRILDSAAETASGLTENNAELTKGLNFVADETTRAGQIWNDLVFDDKTGTVKTNALEEIDKASQSEQGWKEIKFMLKSADVDSNSRATILEVIQDNGKWNDLTFKEKKLSAIYDGTNEVMDALNDMGEWNNLDSKDQVLLAKAETSEDVIQALKDIGRWDMVDPETQRLLIDNSEVFTKVRASEDVIVSYNGEKVSLKTLLADNADLVQKVQSGENVVVKYNGQKVDLKQLFGNNMDLLAKLSYGIDSIVSYNGKEVGLKTLLANNADVLAKLQSGKDVIVEYNGQQVNLKNLLANNADVVSKANEGMTVISDFNNYDPESKYFDASTNASDVVGPIDTAKSSWEGLYGMNDFKKFTVQFAAEGNPAGYAKGTNFHKGGPALVNDAPGPNYQELITNPDGTSFIMKGRNILLNLQRGASVLRGDKTAAWKRSIPRFAAGTKKQVIPTAQISSESLVMQTIDTVISALSSIFKGQQPVKNDDSVIIEQLIESNKQQAQMIALLQAILAKDLKIDDKALTKHVSEQQARVFDSYLYEAGGG